MAGKTFAEILNAALNSRGATAGDVARDLKDRGFKIDRSTIHRWANGDKNPSPGKLPIIHQLPRLLNLSPTEEEEFVRAAYAAMGLNPPPRTRHSPAAPDFHHRRHTGLDFPTPFAGREWELARLKSWIEQRRSVAITGAGGVGKTRLAQALLEVAADGKFPHGCDYLTVSPTQTSGQIMRHVARLIGIELGQTDAGVSDRAILAEMQAKTTGIQLLFALDNVDRPEQVSALVRGLPGVTWVLTGQSGRLGKIVNNSLSLERPATPEAVAMLLAHARYAPVADRRDDATARIAERLGRLPLAIKLAAAMLTNDRFGSLAELDAWLEASGLRRRSSPTASLDLYFERIIDAQPPPVRRTFELCGAFVGSPMPMAALQTVGRAAGFVPSPADWDTLADYAIVERTADGAVHLHSLLHDYAVARLRATPHFAAARAGFVSHYLALAESLSRKGQFDRDLRPMVPAEQNLLGAAEVLYETQDWVGLQRMWPALTGFLWTMGKRRDYERIDRYCLEAARALENVEWTAVILSELGYARKDEGDWTGAEALFRESQALYDAIPGGAVGRARLRRYRSQVALERGDFDGALDLLAEAEAHLARADDAPPKVRIQAEMLLHSAWMTAFHRRGDLNAAEASGRMAERLHRQVGFSDHNEFLEELGDIFQRRGLMDEAVRVWELMLSFRGDLPFLPQHAEVRLRLAWAYAARGESERAMEAAQDAGQIFERYGQTERHDLADDLAARIELGTELPPFTDLFSI